MMKPSSPPVLTERWLREEVQPPSTSPRAECLDPNSRERELLDRARRELPRELTERYAKLVAKREAGALSEAEHAELIRLTERAEADWAERLEAAAQLAQIRQISLEKIVRELRSRQRRHG